MLRWGVFQHEMNYLHGKYYLSFAGISPWARRIPTSLDRMTKVPALYKLNNKFTDLWLYSFIVPSRLSSRPLIYLFLFQNTN